MNAISFVDTNLLVYSRDSSDADKNVRAREWLKQLWRNGRGRISYQILNEYYAVVTRKLTYPLSVDQARRGVMNLITWKPVPNSRELMEDTWCMQDRFGLSWWDSLVVAAARMAGCRYLLTEDLQNEQDLDGLLVMNPFPTTPGDAL